jgi:DNA protecting protein DprA
LLSAPAVAIVGARACSSYGAQVARMLGRDLAAAGLVVVSGLARGIDGEAHRGALETDGHTVAVLGCGIDRDYPAAHAGLARSIAERSLIVSEYEPGVEPSPWQFPARNRVIAGLCAATVVVEARERSGALITADFALDEGREVFAVPGEITSSLSTGTNALLRLGATPLTSAADVLESFGLEKPEKAKPRVGDAAASLLPHLPATVDELVRASRLSAAEVAAALAELELAGAAAEGDGLYRSLHWHRPVETTPFWLDEPRAHLEAPPSERVDVAVIGAGVTGCACALALAGGGSSVRVHDARGVAEGASGRNGGFALRGGAARYDVARETYGSDGARTLWQRTEAALDRLKALAGDTFRRTGSLRLASDEEERAEILAEYEALREDGFAAEWREELPHLRPSFRGAIFHPTDGSLQPARFVLRLAAAAAEGGVAFAEHSRIESLDELDADQIVIATDGSGRGLLPELDDAVWPARGQVVTTAPLDEQLFACPHYARNGFDYWQQLTDGRIVLGGFRDFSILTEMTDDETTTEPIQQALDSFLGELLGVMPTVTHRWAGIFGLTQDLLPLVGAVPDREGTWVAAGYSGHGNVLGFMCGELVASALLGGEDPLLELFSPARLLVSPG